MKSVLIGIAGGTGSGKSTFTNRLKDAFHDDIAVLYHDNYYKKQDGIPFDERKKMNYDPSSGSAGRAEERENRPMSRVRLFPAQPVGSVFNGPPEKGDTGGGNPGLCRPEAPRYVRHQDFCGGGCR